MPKISIMGDRSIPVAPNLTVGMYLLIGERILEKNLSSKILIFPRGWVEGTSIQLNIIQPNKP